MGQDAKLPTLSYSADTLRSFDVGQRCALPRVLRKRLFSLRIWSLRHKYNDNFTTPKDSVLQQKNVITGDNGANDNTGIKKQVKYDIKLGDGNMAFK